MRSFMHHFSHCGNLNKLVMIQILKIGHLVGMISFIYHRIELFDWTFFARRDFCLYLCIRNKKQNEVSDVISQIN